jgi:pSer/pThr/pTyr-binding forkhead associated (FHA) protein
MPKLYILLPSEVARTIDLTDNLITIGRTNENAICIPDINVSKRHGILVRDGDDYQLHDFKSTNGTFVNGERIMAVKLKDGVSIHLGSVELRYESALAKVAPLGAKQSDLETARPSDAGLQPASAKERGMSKKVKPEFAGSKLQSGPVTLLPGFSAKPIPPPPPKAPEETH